MHINHYSIDERRDLVVPGNLEETLEFCVEHLISCLQAAIEKRGIATIALSGGSTPKAIFQSLVTHRLAKKIPWSQVYLFWSDERAIAPDHADSNYHMAMESGFNKLPILPSHIFRMEAEKELEKNALHYENLIKQHVPEASFDLLMLGMGEDGHTASLFPHTKAINESTRLVIGNYIPEKSTWRMTLTFPCINQAKNIVFYVMGDAKKERLKNVLLDRSQPPLPASLIGTKEHKALWICDSAAAKIVLAQIS